MAASLNLSPCQIILAAVMEAQIQGARNEQTINCEQAQNLSYVFFMKLAVNAVSWVPNQAQDGTCTVISHCKKLFTFMRTCRSKLPATSHTLFETTALNDCR